MTRTPIRLVAIDLDDTLLTDDLVISPGAQQAISQAMDEGIVVTLATGRMYPSARPFARELQLNGPLITYNGALIRTVGGDTWWHKPVPRPLALELFDYAADDGWELQCYCDDRLYVPRIDDDVRYYTDIANVPAQAVKDMHALLEHRESTKLLAVGEPEEIRERAARLTEVFRERIAVTISKPRFVEMLHVDVSKAAALAEVARRLGIDRGQVLAIGDSFNDLEMIRWAGIGVAMGNAPPEIQALADHVVDSNMEEGVLEAFERFVFAP